VTASIASLHAAASLYNFLPVAKTKATQKISHPHLATSFYFLITINKFLSNAPANFLVDVLVRGKINCVSWLLR
jgi:hypothetical protein